MVNAMELSTDRAWTEVEIKTFDFELPLTGKLGVDCRSGGAQGNYTLVLRFTNKLNTPGNVSVTSGLGSVSGTPIIKNNTMTVNLTGVANGQKIVVTLANVTDKYGRTLASAKVPVGILLGDVDGNKTVDNKDVNLVTAKVGATAGATNFRSDVNVDGSITQDDVTVTQAQVGTREGGSELCYQLLSRIGVIAESLA